MKKIQLIKTIGTAIITSLVVITSVNAQRRGEGISRGGGSVSNSPAPAPSYHGSNNNFSYVPNVPPSTGGGNHITTSPRPSNPAVFGSGTNNGGGNGERFARPSRPNTSYNGNIGGGYHPHEHGGGYNHGGGYGSGDGRGYNGYNGYGGGEGYGYRGYGLNIFSPYAVYPFYPTLGLRLSWLPFGYYSFLYDGYPYYYYNSVFYTRTEDNHYEIVTPPLGARVTSIPNNSKEVVVNGNKYYECNGTYYQEELDSSNKVVYHVVGTNGELNQPKTPQVVYQPLLGDIVPQLPSGCSTVYLNGQKYYESTDNIYYQELQDGDKIAYKIVGK